MNEQNEIKGDWYEDIAAEEAKRSSEEQEAAELAPEREPMTSDSLSEFCLDHNTRRSCWPSGGEITYTNH